MSRPGEEGASRLFGQQGAQTARLLIYLLISIALMVMDQRGQYVPRVRDAVVGAVEPVYVLVELPQRAASAIGGEFAAKGDLREENEGLRQELLRQSGSVQQLAALRQENARLRALLDASAGRDFEYRFAELAQVDLDPFSHRVLIDRGERDGVFEGQAVIDGQGVMGQVDEVGGSYAHVRLISDPNHALPVQINRTGLRTVAYGSGATSTLVLPNVPPQADIREGDLLITSGLGERFPPGYPVATVVTIMRDPGSTFVRVEAQPLAALDRGREVLLVMPTVAEPSVEDPLAASENDRPNPEPSGEGEPQ